MMMMTMTTTNNNIATTYPDSSAKPVGPLCEILEAVRGYLEYAMKSELKDDRLNIVLNSVKKEKGTEEEDVVITLLRIEEETSRKSQNTYYREELVDEGQTKRRLYPTSPDIDINLEILISSHASNYEYALTQISTVIYLMNSIKTAVKPNRMDQAVFKTLQSLSVSMMNLSFDQHLSMWQTLGGNLVPSAAYKIRMVTVTGIPVQNAADLITKQPTIVEVGDMESRTRPLDDLPDQPELEPEPEQGPEPEPVPEPDSEIHPLGTWTIREV